jgi:hypothetical protein
MRASDGPKKRSTYANLPDTQGSLKKLLRSILKSVQAVVFNLPTVILSSALPYIGLPLAVLGRNDKYPSLKFPRNPFVSVFGAFLALYASCGISAVITMKQKYTYVLATLALGIL